MKTIKMSLKNIQGKLSRQEMKNIMAGSDGQIVFCASGPICQQSQHMCCPENFGMWGLGHCVPCN